ncbi:MAG: nicotinamide riboside transporter PnuC [Flavobacteriales bacterium]|nr:nicotinamide riboside transporter PnuC [Flavobacteriales bacterium]
METWIAIEALAVAGNLAYTVLLMLEKRVGWLFGMAGSALGMALFWHQHVYAQVVLNLVYVVMGAYGWWAWGRNGGAEPPIVRWKWPAHIAVLAGGAAAAVVLALLAGLLPDARHVGLDASVTAFSLLATWMLARKVLESWAWWIVTDAGAIVLYLLMGLHLYAGLYMVYVGLSVIALVRWSRSYARGAQVRG